MNNAMRLPSTAYSPLSNLHAPNLCVICVILLLAGCGRSLESTVQGTVTFNGKPLLTGTGKITFHPVKGGAAAYGTILSDGTYRLQTGKTGGLTAGEYAVAVMATEPQTPAQVAALSMPKLITPVRYADVKTSDLRCTVNSGANQIDLTLKP